MFGETMPEPMSNGDLKGLQAETTVTRRRSLKYSRSGSFGELGRLVFDIYLIGL